MPGGGDGGMGKHGSFNSDQRSSRSRSRSPRPDGDVDVACAVHAPTGVWGDVGGATSGVDGGFSFSQVAIPTHPQEIDEEEIIFRIVYERANTPALSHTPGPPRAL